MPADPQDLENRLSYRFNDRNLLVRALTHKSLASERKPPGHTLDNEQLEFLGDSILGFLVSESLVQRHPDSPEGVLSKLKAHVVSAAHLYEVAGFLGLGEFLHLGRGEEMSGGRLKKALLANAVEALIAAMYLDGGIEVARKFVVLNVLGDTLPDPALNPQPADYKGALQELAQSLKLPHPRYITAEESGPAHARTFVIEARIGQIHSTRGEGSSKKAAAQQAAKALIERLRP
jgi:ribonuclease-3